MLVPATIGVVLALAVSLFARLSGLDRDRAFYPVAAGLFGHGGFDFIHAYLIDNPGVPGFWPAFCGAYDVAAGAWLAGMILIEKRGNPRSLR